MSASRGDDVVLLGGARTPIGRLLGGLAGQSAAELGAVAIAAAIERSGIDALQVGHVFMGQVLTAGAGQLPARQAAVGAGLPMTVPAVTVGKVCLSGIQAVIQAGMLLRADGADVVVAGGQESMSNAPHLLAGRTGVKFGPITMADHMALDGLTDAFSGTPMGLLTEQANDDDPVSRADSDAFAVRSHRLAAAAMTAGAYGDEVVPVTGAEGMAVLAADEGVRADTTSERLARLRSAFRQDGTVTAGNASPISDGACAMVLTTRSHADRLGVRAVAEIGSFGMVAGPDTRLQLQPANAIAAACAREGIAPADLDLLEINEAFAPVVIASARALGIGLDRVNVSGGAIAIGHPIGMSGARIVLHLALELARRGGGVGAAALCGGGGQGDALIVRVPRG